MNDTTDQDEPKESKSDSGSDGTSADASTGGDRPAKRKRRRRRSPRKGAKKAAPDGDQAEAGRSAAEEQPAEVATEAPEPSDKGDQQDAPPAAPTKKRRARRGRRSSSKKKSSKGADAEGPPDEAATEPREPDQTDTPAGPPTDQPAEAAGSEEPEADAEQPAGGKRSGRQRSRSQGKPDIQVAPVSKIGHGREMLINVVPGEECRIALTLDGKLEELFIERASAESHVGNIYKGRVTNVEPSIQAAFVDFGLTKNGFLHISDIVPQYFPSYDGEPEEIGRKTPHRDRPPIQKCLRRGQEVIVQIIKEGIGTKGPTLNTYISLPGRFLVMMPGMGRLGVSRRIEDEEDRQQMREMLNQLDLPKGKGFILRTAGRGRTKRELQRDLNYLMRLWKNVSDRLKSERAPATLYQESDLAIRTVRDTLEGDIERLVIDDEETARKIREFLAIAMPRASEKLLVYKDPEPLFYRYGIEEEINKLHSRLVPLSSGGSLVIESTEALVAIDVNSGKYREQKNAEETARRINLEASDEIARQLRLRDLGGVIVCDFIDMRLDKNCREVERSLREALRRHKERAKILRMSRFGIIEMTRQRSRPSILRSVQHDCPHCRGTGLIKTPESTALDAMRMLQLAGHRDAIESVEVRVCLDVASELLNRRRRSILELESGSGKKIVVRGIPDFGPDQIAFECLDARGRRVGFP